MWQRWLLLDQGVALHVVPDDSALVRWVGTLAALAATLVAVEAEVGILDVLQLVDWCASSTKRGVLGNIEACIETIKLDLLIGIGQRQDATPGRVAPHLQDLHAAATGVAHLLAEEPERLAISRNLSAREVFFSMDKIPVVVARVDGPIIRRFQHVKVSRIQSRAGHL